MREQAQTIAARPAADDASRHATREDAARPATREDFERVGGRLDAMVRAQMRMIGELQEVRQLCADVNGTLVRIIHHLGIVEK